MINPSAATLEKYGKTSIFFTLLSTLFLVIFNFTLTNMAAPYIVGDLGGSNDISSYTITFYSLGNALSIPLAKSILDRVGIFRLYLSCLLLFAFFSYLCGIAPNYPIFVGFRFLQGFVTGPFYILIMGLIGVLVPKEKKTFYTSIVITTFAVVPVFGACWGGWIAYDFSWRYFFYIDTAVILILFALISFQLKGFPAEEEEKKPFDAIGYLVYFLGVFSLALFLTTGQQLDWFRSPFLCIVFVIGVLCLGFFVLWSWHHPHPVLEVRFFKKIHFSFGLLNLSLLFSAYFGMVLLLALWLTLDANYTPIWVGLLIGTMAVAGLFPKFLIDKRHGLWDLRFSLGLALIFFIVSCFHTAIFNVHISFGLIAFSRILAGFGLAFFLPPLFRLCFHIFPERESVKVISIFQVVRALSSGLGAAIYTTVWQRRRVFYHDRLGEQLTAFSEETQQFFVNAKGFHIEGDSAYAKLGYFLERESTSLALDDVFYLMGWIMVGLLILLLLSFFLRKEPFFPEKYLQEEKHE